MRSCVTEHDFNAATCPECKRAYDAGESPLFIGRQTTMPEVDPYPLANVSPRPPAPPCKGCKGEEEFSATVSSVKALQVSLVSKGVGDNLLALTTAAAMQDHYGLPVAFSCTARGSQWARLFWPWVETTPLKVPTCFCECTTEGKTKLDRLKTSRWRFWASEAGVTPRLPDPMPLPAAALEWAIPYAGRIVLAPYAAHESRTWPLWHWLALEELLIARGHRTVILDTNAERVAPFKGDKLISASPPRVAAVIRQATCTVGNDSGMIHVAGMLRRPGVGIVHPVSDRGIFDLYPTVKTIDADKLTPAAVADAVSERVRASLDDGFPWGDFAEILVEADRWRTEAWLPVYSALWRTVRDLNPRTVVEIGVRAGYSSWTILDACPDAEMVGVDMDAAEHGGYVGAHQHAEKLMAGKNWRLVIADSHTLDKLPIDAPELCYVDGAHDTEGCLADLNLAERSGAKALLVDDVTNLPSVWAAVKRFMGDHPERRWRYIPSSTGLYLIERKEI